MTLKSAARRASGIARSKNSEPHALREESRQFEQLVSDLSAAFVQTPAPLIDREITRWLKQIVLVLGLDRSSIAQLEPDGLSMRVTHQWSRPGLTRVPVRYDLGTNLRWYSAKLFAGEEIVYSDADQLPPEAWGDRSRVGRLIPKSHYGCPLRVGGKVVGGLGFATLTSTRSWPPRIVQRLRLVAEIIGNAIARKESAAELTRLREELNRVSRVSTMGELAASLAHELNQPLTAILNNAEVVQSLLESEAPDLAEIKAAMADIVEDDTRASETIMRLRGFFQRGRIEKSSIALADIVGDIGRIVINDAAIRNVSLTIDTVESLPLVLGDRVQLRQVVINLITNAFEAFDSIEQGPREVRVELVRAERGWLRLQVSDSGGGIDAETMPRIFDPFFTTKSAGMGMGLAISRSIILAHGGRLTASQNRPRGTTFLIELPVES